MNGQLDVTTKGRQSTANLKKLFAIVGTLVLAGLFHLTIPALPLRSPLIVDPREMDTNATIPLGSYTGRNGDQMNIELFYSSGGLWHGDVSPDDSGGMFMHNYVSPVFDNSSGWSNSLELPEVKLGDAYAIYDEQGDYIGVCPDQPQSAYYYVKRISVSIPGVGTHELRKDDLLYQTVCANRPPPDLSGVFYSVDGSKLRYDNDQKILYIPDGGRYFFEQINTPNPADVGLRGTKYTDPNGNTRTYNAAGGYWMDTLGRQFVQPRLREPQVGEQNITVPGLNNTPLTYTLKWERLEQALASGQQLHYRGDKNCLVLSNTNQPTGSYLPALFKTVTPNYNCADYNPNDINNPLKFNPVVLSEARLPNGQKYQYKYTPYGELERIVYPTGGYQRFRYVTDVCQLGANNTYTCQQKSQSTDPNGKRYVAERWTSPSGNGNDEEHWQYPNQGNTISPDGVLNSIYAPGMYYQENYGFTDIRLHLKSISESLSTYNGQMQRRSLIDRQVTATTFPATPGKSAYAATRDPRVFGEINVAFESSDPDYALATLTRTEYDSHADPGYFAQLNPVRVKRYDYVVVPRATAQTANFETLATYFDGRQPEIVEETDYLYDPAYKARNIITLPVEKRILKGDGTTVVAKSRIAYDEPNYLEAATITNAIGWENPNTNLRGLPTTTKSWSDIAGNQFVEAHVKYDQFGNVIKSWDAKGNVSQIEYDATHHAYPTRTISPTPGNGTNGSSQTFEATATFDPMTGLPLSATDANGQTTVMSYADPVTGATDPLLRLRKVTAPNGHQTITEYGAGTAAATRFVKVKTQIDETRWKEGYTWYDGIGRTIKSQSVESTGDVFAETVYDNMGRVKKSTNPYRADETKLWTESFYDDLGRIVRIRTPDLAEISTSYSLATTGSHIGTVKLVTDQAGKKRKGIANALGRMTRVIEDPDGQNLSTDYVFDTVGNLRKTIQGEQSRYFMYDDLGRLLYAKQPEQGANASFISTDPITGNAQWSAKYAYDPNGNIATTTDARNVSVTGTYDNLNRLILRDYSDASMPDVSFYYDGTGLSAVPAFSKGKTTKVYSSVSESRYTSFDNLGKLLTSQQITDGQAYNFSYKFNLSGALEQETYPSGRVVKTEIDADGALSRVFGNAAGRTEKTYASSFSYNSSGAVESMKLGNGRWETAKYNNRQQVEEIGLGSSATDTSLLKLSFGYGAATGNNGSLKSQTTVVPTVGGNAGFSAVQTYGYDSLNRLESATEITNGNPTPSWKQTFSYDRYGNRRFVAAETTTLGNCQQAQCNPLINTSDNRFSSGQNYLYDTNGNLTQDADGEKFVYDAENRQTQFRDANNGLVATYFYDGEGKRVKKVLANTLEETIFVYNAGGQLAAEYLINPPAPTAPPSIRYLTNDHLGSTRVITDHNGTAITRKDYGAFGDETITAQRTSGLGYTAQDNLRQDYTGYQKDDESGLDYAQARYYNSSHGRFTSVDPLTASATIKNPQTFNRYSYVLNSPYKFTDPLGLLPISASSSSGCSAENASCDDGDSRADGESEYEERLQRTYNGIAAQRAANNGNTEEFLRLWEEHDYIDAFDSRGNLLVRPGTGTVTVTVLEDGPNDDMWISESGITLLKSYEGAVDSSGSAVLTYYDTDGSGNCTVGWGHLANYGGCGANKGRTITQEQAEAFFQEDLRKHVANVKSKIKVELFQAEFDALVILDFNYGIGSRSTPKLLKALNTLRSRNADLSGIAREWKDIGGAAGLPARRRDELELFFFGEYGRGKGK